MSEEIYDGAAARVAIALAARLSAVVPPGFIVSALSSEVRIVHEGGTSERWFLDTMLQPHEADRVAWSGVIGTVLSNVQEVIARCTGVPWPGQSSMPVPFVRDRGADLRLGYGREQQPIIELPPVPWSVVGQKLS